MRYLIVLLLILGSCSKESKTQVSPIVLQGLSDFGKVILSDRIDTVIVLNNSDQAEPIPIDFPLSPPFYLVGTSPQGCTSSLVPALTICALKVRFSPDQKGKYSLNLMFRNASLKLKGEGINPGVLSLLEQSFSIGSVFAGDQRSLRLVLTNSGEASLVYPDLALPDDISVQNTTCESTIPPQGSCFLDLLVSPTLATSVYQKQVLLSTGESEQSVLVSGEVLPSSSSGQITFSVGSHDPVFVVRNEPLSIFVSTNVIRDRFGNPIQDGTPVSVSISNFIFEPNLNTQTQVFLSQGGVVSFVLKSFGQENAQTASFSAQTDTSFGSYSFTIKNP